MCKYLYLFVLIVIFLYLIKKHYFFYKCFYIKLGHKRLEIGIKGNK